MNGHDNIAIELTNPPLADEDEYQAVPTNCYECRDSMIENLLDKNDQDYDVCSCNHPDFPAPPTVHTRHKRQYSMTLGKWLEPGSWEVPGDRQVQDFMLGLPNLCPLHPENSEL